MLKTLKFLFFTSIIIVLILGSISYIIKPQEILNIKEYDKAQYENLSIWGLGKADYSFSNYLENRDYKPDDEAKRKEMAKKLEEYYSKNDEKRQTRFWIYTYLLAIIITLFNLVLYKFLSLIKKKKKALKASFFTLSIFIFFTIYTIFKIDSLNDYKYAFIGDTLPTIYLFFLRGVTIGVPIVIGFSFFKWIYSKEFPSKFAPKYNRFFYLPILLLLFAFSFQLYFDDIVSVIYGNDTLENVRSAILGASIFLVCLTILFFGRKSKGLKNIKKSLLPSTTFLFQILIASIGVYALVFFSLLFEIIVEKNKTNWVLDKNIYYIGSVLKDFPFQYIYYIGIVNVITLLLINRARRKKEDLEYDDDPWLLKNNPLDTSRLYHLEMSLRKDLTDNVEKLIEDVERELSYLHDMKQRYLFLLKQWQSITPMSDQQWRDWGENPRQRRYHYNTMSNIIQGFNSEIFKVDQYLKRYNEAYNNLIKRAPKAKSFGAPDNFDDYDGFNIEPIANEPKDIPTLIPETAQNDDIDKVDIDELEGMNEEDEII